MTRKELDRAEVAIAAVKTGRWNDDTENEALSTVLDELWAAALEDSNKALAARLGRAYNQLTREWSPSLRSAAGPSMLIHTSTSVNGVQIQIQLLSLVAIVRT